MLKVLEADFARLPELLGRGLAPVSVPDLPSDNLSQGQFEPEPAAEAPAEQLGLF
jgi:hypothetical protein